ncbi:FAD-dependent monooxygenase [Streptomyces europaeiscabiei]|uniref:FAD-dependent monooxygenase n=1 Tax=Streptomyces europaeiscabiei TaxID=146819 RepID=UPI002E0F4F90|nr:FAD-dependent monooxygenase [Streptomyces europaeiscabiei]
MHAHGYPYPWLGALAEVPPSCPELIHAHGEGGLAPRSMRVRDELAARLAIDADRSPERGPGTAKSAHPCAVTSTSRCATGALLLAGDAARIVPPTGAKGLDHAVSDVRVPARAFI